jgi:hypothetical protein
MSDNLPFFQQLRTFFECLQIAENREDECRVRANSWSDAVLAKT